MYIKRTSFGKIGVGLFIILAVFIFLSLQTKAAEQSDAIGVRIMPNPSHDSIETWYAKQGFRGSPQSLIVDGYEAIRDGRTVFVNAANLDTSNNKLYTNVYLISYNQESEVKTVDILGQLVSHWKFNSNATTLGQCAIATLNCQADADCPKDSLCSNLATDLNHGKCVLKEAKNCLVDSDCPVNLFCNSLKAKMTRDVKRLGQFNQIKDALDSFKRNNSSYPSLSVGTYVSGSSLSLWPSWQETLWPQLKINSLLIDPINTLGYCAGYDPITCWNKDKNEFVNSDLVLPYGSYAFIYNASKNGSNFDLCSVFESKLAGIDTAEGQFTSNSCAVGTGFGGTNSNQPPVIKGSYTNGETGKEFNGYVKAEDLEGDIILWNLEIISPIADWSSWSSLPVLQETGNAGQKKIYATKSGNPGSYKMLLKLTDSRGAATTTELTFNISASGKPLIEAENVDYFVDPVNPLKYTFYVQGSNSVPTYSFKPVNPTNNQEINLSITNATVNSTSVGLNRIKIDLLIPFSPSIKILKDLTIPYRITATANGSSSTHDININLKTEQPYLDFQCENMARTGQPYQISENSTPRSCLLGSLKSGSHTLSYEVVGPSGLSIKSDSLNAYLEASAIFSSSVDNEVKIKVTNEYGATAEKTFKLKVNTFCGDGVKQKPNSEGRGGLYNDGMEDCDGADGVATGISRSSAVQYSCNTGLNIKTPYPILDSNSCIFKSAKSGGGYCGDGLCQLKIGDVNMESGCNCPEDCLSAHPCCGDGKVTEGEVCDTGLPEETCIGVFKDGIPGYCGDIPVSGVRSCKTDCSAWEECELAAPSFVAQSSTGCTTTNPKLTDYACCELTSCVNDACECCGRYSTDPDWLDLMQQASSTGYAFKKVMSPNSGACTVSSSDVTLCTCGTPGCSAAPLCPKPTDPKNKLNNSCVIAQGLSNLRNWAVFTNHTTAYYKCWK